MTDGPQMLMPAPGVWIVIRGLVLNRSTLIFGEACAQFKSAHAINTIPKQSTCPPVVSMSRACHLSVFFRVSWRCYSSYGNYAFRIQTGLVPTQIVGFQLGQDEPVEAALKAWCNPELEFLAGDETIFR